MADGGDGPVPDAVMAELNSRIANVPGLAEALPGMSEEQRAMVLTNLLLSSSAGGDSANDIEKQLAALAQAVGQPAAAGDTSKVVTPAAGFVIKTLTMQQWKRPAPAHSRATGAAIVPPGTKVFINIAGHDAIAAIRRVKRLKDAGEGEEEGISIPVAVGDVKDDVDKHAAAVLVVDVIVHPAVLADVERDMTGSFRHFLAELASQYVERKHGLELSAQYRMPPGLKYKGDAVTSQRVRAQAADLAGKISAADAEDASPLQVLVKAGAIAQPVVQASARRPVQPTPAASTAPVSGSGIRGKYSQAMDVRVLAAPSAGAVAGMTAAGGDADGPAVSPRVEALVSVEPAVQHAQARVLIQEADAPPSDAAAAGVTSSGGKQRKRVQFAGIEEEPPPALKESRSVRVAAPGMTPLFAVFLHTNDAWGEVGWESMPDPSAAGTSSGSTNPMHARSASASAASSHLRVRAVIEPRVAYETTRCMLLVGFPLRPGVSATDGTPLDISHASVTLEDLQDHVRVDMPGYRAIVCDATARVLQVQLTVRETEGLPRIPPSLLRPSDVAARGLPSDAACPLSEEAANALLLAYVRAGANDTSPDEGSKQWMVLHALHDPSTDESDDREAETDKPGVTSTETPYVEGEVLPEDAFHASDALSQHFIRQREEERAKREEERAAAAAAQAPAPADEGPAVDAAANSMDAQVARVDLGAYVLSERGAQDALDAGQLAAALSAQGVAITEAELLRIPGVASKAVWELL